MPELLVPTFVEVPFQTLVHRIDNGSRGLAQLSSLLSEGKDLQEKDILYALKVGRANVFDHEIEASTSERLLGFYKNYYLYLYKGAMQQHKDYNDHVLSLLEMLKSKRGSKVMSIKQTIQNDFKMIASAKEALEKAKKVLAKAKADRLRARDKLAVLERALTETQRINEEKLKEAKDPGSKFSMGRMFSAFESNPEQDRDKQARKLEKRKNEVQMARQGIVDRKKDLLDAFAALDNDYAKSSLDFQEMELERMCALRSSIKSFCDIEKAALLHKLDLLKSLEEAVTLQQPEEDLALFISQCKHTELTHKFSHALELLNDRLQTSLVEEQTAEEEESSPPDETSTPDAVGDAEDSDLQALLPREAIDIEDLQSVQLNDLISQVFGDEHPDFERESARLPGEEDWKSAFLSKDSRDRFLMELDRRRGKSASLPHPAYESMSHAMKAFLDQCHDTGDVMSAMRISNMSNTFHESLNVKASDSPPDSSQTAEDHDEAESSTSVLTHSRSCSEDTIKAYLQSDPKLRAHTIWKKEGFWASALRESVLAELHRSPPIHWPEMSPEELREAVIAVHNIVFGQLGSLSFAMQQQNLPNDEVVNQIRLLSQITQLPEDQEFQLIASITGQKVKEYTPPPLLASHLPADHGQGQMALSMELPATTAGVVMSMEQDSTADSADPVALPSVPVVSGVVTEVADTPDEADHKGEGIEQAAVMQLQGLLGPTKPQDHPTKPQGQPTKPTPPAVAVKAQTVPTPIPLQAPSHAIPTAVPDTPQQFSYLQSFSSKLFSGSKSTPRAAPVAAPIAAAPVETNTVKGAEKYQDDDFAVL